MGIGRLVTYIGIPAAVGALVSLVGYDDISAVEGMRQAVIAGLPTAALFGSTDPDRIDDILDFAEEHPYSMPLLGAAALAGLYCLGGLGMEYLTGTNISQGFTSVVGGVEGAINGIIVSLIARSR